MFTLIEHGDVYAPEPQSVQSVLLAGDKIVKIGAVDGAKLAALDLPCEIVDATGCLVTPGLIDPHEHLIGRTARKASPAGPPKCRSASS